MNQNILSKLIFSLAALALACSVWAQDSVSGSVDDTGSPNFNVRKHGRTASLKKRATPAKADATFLRGVCGVVKSENLMIPGPCVNILLVLDDNKGVEVERARTNTQGVFEFSVDKGKAYRLVSGSRLYEIVTPQGDVHGGTSINLKIREK